MNTSTIIFKGMFGRVRTKVYRGYLLGKYPAEPYRSVPVGFGTNSKPVPETSVSSVRPFKCTPGAGIPSTAIPGVPVFAQYGLDIGTRHFGKFGTTSILKATRYILPTTGRSAV